MPSTGPSARPARSRVGRSRSDDIGSARRALIRTERLAARDLRASAVRHQREPTRHERLARHAEHRP